MTVPNELSWVLQQLESSGLTYALTGSLASAAWGRPRATYDADIVVALRSGDIDLLLHTFPSPGWYLDREMIGQAIAVGGEFNAIQAETGTKLDFWIKGNNPVDNLRMRRRQRATVAGVECWLLSPEDTILAKLQWLAQAPSERQKSDVAGIIAVRTDLDMEYLRQWADELDVRALLEELLAG